MGEASYNELLNRAYLLPIDASELAMLGEAELARFRALEAILADSVDGGSRSGARPQRPEGPGGVPEGLREPAGGDDPLPGVKRLVTLPASLGAFHIRQLPEAFKPTSPGGFMNAPGLYDEDRGGFFFIPTYDPKSRNFYIRAAIEDPRPILGHEGIPGHFLQISIANALRNEIRREHDDGVFVEGWALYGEEMLLRTGPVRRRIGRAGAGSAPCPATARRASAWT